MFTYKTKGTCALEIDFDIQDGILTEINFVRGCQGNLAGISSLVKGMKVDDIIEKLDGIDCRNKGTSCPDQLAKALKWWKENN